MVNQGDTAPNFEVVGAGGEIIRLSDLKGKPVVVYFYPKDDTSGCTREAIAFTDLHAGFLPVLASKSSAYRLTRPRAMTSSKPNTS